MSTGKLIVTASPHIRSQDSVPRIMWNVVASLVPVVVAATWFFGVSALLQIATATIAAVLTERATGKGGAIADGSATITGLLLGLTLPAGFPLWMTALGAAFAIVFGKQVWGGLGQNVFNPALVGRAFLQAAFPVAITTWPSPGGGFFTGLIIGNTGGSLGETAALVILAGGLYLAWRGYLNWRIPVSIMLTVMALSAIIHFFDAIKPDPLFMLFSGGLILGAVYIATDPVTSPITNLGKWVFGVGIGILVVVIRIWGGLPEGVMYAILFMNALTPFINRATQPRVFGTGLVGVT